MKKLLLTGSGILLGTLAAALPAAALAQTATVSVSANPNISAIGASTTVKAKGTASIATIQARANEEIKRRITNLQNLSTRVGQMKNLSAAEISAMQSSISAEISTMTSLQATIDADTVLATLKTDVQSIAKDYRVYLLILPQDRIAAAVDRVTTIVGLMQNLESKLEARITAAGNPSAAVTAYADMQAKIADAQTQSSAALSETQSLQPDQGNAATQASNTAALKDAQAKLKTAEADLKAARADITTIMTAVKGSGSVSASTSASAQ